MIIQIFMIFIIVVAIVIIDVIVIVITIIVVIIILMMEDYGLEVLVKTPGLYQVSKLRNRIFTNFNVFERMNLYYLLVVIQKSLYF